MARYLELRRHTDSDADLLTEDGVRAALEIGRRVAGPYVLLVSSGAQRRPLDVDESEELAARIDAERDGRDLIGRCARLPELERGAVELVDLAGLTPKEAASALGVSRAVLRKRLSRARARLRKEHQGDE